MASVKMKADKLNYEGSEALRLCARTSSSAGMIKNDRVYQLRSR